jgi:hypothetical protein
MRVLESLSVDEYYQTINTWMKIVDERNKAIENVSSDSGSSEGQSRKRLTAKK